MPERSGMQRFEWERLIRDLPSSSPLWAHDDRCGTGCWRKDGSRLSPSTLKHVALTLGTYAQAADGTRVFPGIGHPAHRPDDCGREGCDHEATGLVRATGRHRSTIIASLAHLEMVGLICAKVRASRRGVPRHHATEYMLTAPTSFELAALGIRAPWDDPEPAAEPDPEPGPQPDPEPAGAPAWEPALARPTQLAGVARPSAEPYDWFTRRPADSPVLAMNGARPGDVGAAAAARPGGSGSDPPYP